MNGRHAVPASLRRLTAAVALLAGATLAAAPAAALQIERVVSPGGIVAWLIRDHTNPIVSARFVFRGGAALDPAGREGLAQMAAQLLTEGAGPYDSQAFQARREDLAISLDFDAGLDSVGGRLRTLRQNLADAFDLARLALVAPRFDAEAIERVRGRIEARLRRSAEEPNAIAWRTLWRRLLPDHPYGRPAEGTPASVAAIGAEDLRGFVANRLARDNLIVGVVGDIDAAELAPLLDSTFGGLPARAAPWSLPAAQPRADGKTVVVRKAVPQSAIAFAQPGVTRDHPDFFPAVLVNHVLGGGGFTSRLYGEVREKRGLAYSVSSGLNPLVAGAFIQGGAGTANERTAETLAVVRDEWRKLASDGVTADELADAKTFLTGSFPLRFSSSGQIASFLVDVQFDDLGIDYMEKRSRLIEAVTLDDANRVARALFDPAHLTIVVVGEPQGVESAE